MGDEMRESAVIQGDLKKMRTLMLVQCYHWSNIKIKMFPSFLGHPVQS